MLATPSRTYWIGIKNIGRIERLKYECNFHLGNSKKRNDQLEYIQRKLLNIMITRQLQHTTEKTPMEDNFECGVSNSSTNARFQRGTGETVASLGKLDSQIGLRNASRLLNEKKQERLHTNEIHKRKLTDIVRTRWRSKKIDRVVRKPIQKTTGK